jgi:type II secretory pathway pseudopilin PulG
MNQKHPKINARRGFSIVELLVVFFIIGLVMSILIPAISGVRQTARRASTNATMKDLAAASNLFATDRKGQTPGYFPPALMGAQENGDTRGMSAMQNILLDLSGGVAQNQTRDMGGGSLCDEQNGPNVVEVGPTSTNVVRVNLGAIGAPTKDLAKGTIVNAYFNPDRGALVRQCNDAQRLATSPQDHYAMPELVDAWGNPILAWSRDERSTAVFSSVNSGAGGSTPAKFYWASNAGILRAQALGRAGRDHSTATSTLYSMIGGGAVGGGRVVDGAGASWAMGALLGNPAFPRPKLNPGDRDLPAQSRGALVFHSAGQDGWFLGSEDKGGRAAGGPLGPGSSLLDFTANVDPIAFFDDILNSALN